VDSALFVFGLGEKYRRRIESAGRVELSATDLDILGVSKWIHFGCVFWAVVLGVWILGTANPDGSSKWEFAMPAVLPFLSFFVAGPLPSPSQTLNSWSESNGYGEFYEAASQARLMVWTVRAGLIELAINGQATGHNGFTPSPNKAKTAAILFGKMVGGLICLLIWAMPAFMLKW
jgi:hypothetical protein